jgi:hypothetical protein
MRRFALIPLVLLAPACSMNEFVANRMASTFDQTARAMNREESPKTAREAAPALLKMLDSFVEMSPRNPVLLEKAAEQDANFAFAFIEEEDPDRARILYRRAKGYGMRALKERDEDLAKALVGPEDALRKRLAGLEAGDDAIPALFWAAFAWGGEINVSRTDQRLLADLPKVLAVMDRLCAIAPDFYHAGPHMFLAVYYSSRGSALGGDVKKSKEHFEQVMSRGSDTRGKRRPLFLLPYVLYARFYCVALGEKEPEKARKEFVDALKLVRETPLDVDPDNILPNAIAKERAAKLLPQLDDLILPPLDDATTPPK